MFIFHNHSSVRKKTNTHEMLLITMYLFVSTEFTYHWTYKFQTEKKFKLFLTTVQS